MEKNLTAGSVFKTIVFFSLPYLLSYFLQTLYGMADLFIIGRFGSVAETTAVSVGSQVMHLLTVMIVGLAMGTTVNIANAVGAKKPQKASKNIGNTVTLFMSLSLVLMGLLLLLARPITTVMATPPEAAEETVSYLTVCFLGIPFITAYNILASVFRGLGDSKSPMYFIAVACICNIGLDVLLIGVFDLGPVGAALGTTLSQSVSVVLSVCIIAKKRVIGLSKNDFKPNRIVIRQLLSVGLPIAAQDGLIQIAFIVITVIANSRGLNTAAAVGIVEKIIGFVFLVPSSLLSAVSAIGAQNIGAKKPHRAVQTLRDSIFLAVGFGLFCAIGVQFCAESLVALFTDASAENGAEVIRLGGQYLRGYIWDCIFAGIHFCFSGYFCALGKSVLSFAHNILAVVLVRIPGAYWCAKRFPDTLFPMGLATVCGSLLSVSICLIAYFALRKQRNTA